MDELILLPKSKKELLAAKREAKEWQRQISSFPECQREMLSSLHGNANIEGVTSGSFPKIDPPPFQNENFDCRFCHPENFKDNFSEFSFFNSFDDFVEVHSHDSEIETSEPGSHFDGLSEDTSGFIEAETRPQSLREQALAISPPPPKPKSLIWKLGIKVVPLASDGLMRSEDVELGEDVLVAGYPYGEVFSNSIKVTKGIVSANRGLGDDTGQFQIDAAVQPGNSGGPIYDGNGNIVGVVVSQLNKMKFAKRTGSIPENVNFGIKASTVRQFLNASGLTTKWSKRSKSMTTRELAKIAKSQTVMVVCHQ